MALLILGKTKCPLCSQAIGAGQETVATTHFIESPEHPLWLYSDSVIHYECFQAWDQRPLFVAEYNPFLAQRVWGNGTQHHMADDGTVSSFRATH